MFQAFSPKREIFAWLLLQADNPSSYFLAEEKGHRLSSIPPRCWYLQFEKEELM